MEGGRNRGTQHSPALVSASGPGKREVCISLSSIFF